VPVDETSALNFSVVSEPVYDSNSISIGLRGEFVTLKKVKSARNRIVRKPPHASLTCSDDVKMVSIAISESVLNDGAGVYYSVRSMVFYFRVKGLSICWYMNLSCFLFSGTVGFTQLVSRHNARERISEHIKVEIHNPATVSRLS
jgi:hypothetical protein